MSDTVLITLILAVTIVVVLVIFRRQLSRFLFKANRDGVEAEMETHEPAKDEAQTKPNANASAGVTISNNRQVGRGNKIDVGQSDVAVTDNLQLGEGQEINVRPDPTTKTPPPAQQ